MRFYKAILLGALILLSGVVSAQGHSISFDGDWPEVMSEKEKVELLWAKYVDNSLDALQFHSESSGLKKSSMGLRERLKLAEIRASFNSSARMKVVLRNLSPKDALHFASEANLYANLNFVFKGKAAKALKRAKRKIIQASSARARTKKEIEDIVYEGGDLATYESGKYQEGIKLFLFCRKNRNYPCRFVMKDRYDSLERNEDGSLWSLPALAKSASNRPFNITNGQTPQGVHTIDSVMPEANRQLAFGKFRRLILNWVPSDELTKELLPESAQDKSWWAQASIARDNGRKWLRVHGTGRINEDPQSSYYPHRPTSGCISTREGEYPEETYIDQRKLLDRAMKAMRMGPVFENEVRIKGVLYVIELDEKNERVTEASLKEFGVF